MEGGGRHGFRGGGGVGMGGGGRRRQHGRRRHGRRHRRLTDGKAKHGLGLGFLDASEAEAAPAWEEMVDEGGMGGGAGGSQTGRPNMA
jgi:hypothetical protein